MRRLGQHFLKNRAAIEKIIAAIEPARGETIIEIGAGHGELTVPLAEACGRAGCALAAIEKDRELAKDLRSKICDLGIRNVEIIEGDALKILKSYILNLKSYKFVGNIPFYLTGRLFRTLGECEPRPQRAVLMVQREVGERLTASPPRMNRLSASVKLWARPRIAFGVQKENFAPLPEVDASVIVLDEKTSVESPEHLRRALQSVSRLFGQPRKTILNNVMHGFGLSREEALRVLSRASVSPEARPQNLTEEDVAKISNLIHEAGGER